MTSLLLRICILTFCAFLFAGPVLADGSRLVVGDVIGVTVDGEKDLTKAYQINNDGAIVVPQINPIEVKGLNTTDAAEVIRSALGELLVNPQVTVTFIERGKMQVFVVGQVTRKGLVEVGVGDRLVQALAQAGYDETADLAKVTVRRGDNVINADLTKYLSGEDLSVNVELESLDTVVVPRKDMIGTVMVYGKVNKTGSVPIGEGTTFRDLIGMAGDVTVEADTDRITVSREGIAEPMKIDYKRAIDGDPAANVVLKPGDKVYVPEVETAFFTIYGAVSRPAQYPLKGRLTLSEAVGLAGGAVPNLGDLRKVSLNRAPGTDGAAGERLTVDLTKVRSGDQEDVLVKRGDVIVVAEHKAKPNLLDIIRTVLPLGWLFN